MSFALENCERKDGNYSILELLKYNFYLPFFYFGPIMTFDTFYVQVSWTVSMVTLLSFRGWELLYFPAAVTCVCCPLQVNRSDLTRREREMWNINLHGVIHLIVIILVDILFHYMYILTIPTDVKLLKHLSDWALGVCQFIPILIFLIPITWNCTNEEWEFQDLHSHYANKHFPTFSSEVFSQHLESWVFYGSFNLTYSRTDVIALFPVGLAYFNLVYDWVKAAVMFGVISTVSRLDHLDPPKPPKCITMLYVFAETWVKLHHTWWIPGVWYSICIIKSDVLFCSHFDRGINDWLCK